MDGPVRIFLFLDFDGTLAPIAPAPRLVKMHAGMRRLLKETARRKGTRIAIISGRQLTDVRRRTGIPGIVYAGNHGLEIRGRGIAYTEPKAAATAPLLAGIARKLGIALKGYSGVLVENKGLTLSVHYRLLPAVETGRMLSTVRHLLAPALRRKIIRLTAGKKVLEVRPNVSWGKGNALEFILKHAERKGRRRYVPVYIGDDTTDVPAFRAARRRGGFGVYVGRRGRPRGVLCAVASPGRLKDWLKEFIVGI